MRKIMLVVFLTQVLCANSIITLAQTAPTNTSKVPGQTIKEASSASSTASSTNSEKEKPEDTNKKGEAPKTLTLDQAKAQFETTKNNVKVKKAAFITAEDDKNKASKVYEKRVSQGASDDEIKKANKAVVDAIIAKSTAKKALEEAEKDFKAAKDNPSLKAADAQSTTLSLSPTAPTIVIGSKQLFTATGGTLPYQFSIENDTTGNAKIAKIEPNKVEYTAGSDDGSTDLRLTDSSTPTAGTFVTPVRVTLSDNVLTSCKRDDNLAIYTNDLPSWRFGDGLLSFLPEGEWTVGTAVLSETIRYDFAKKKAAVFEGAGIGASFRFYRDVEDVGKSQKLKLHEIKSECRASSLETADERTIATPMFSITPAIFASKPLKDQEFRVEPAIMLGFFQDLINVGAGFNLTGDDGDVGDVFLLFSLGFGFNFGGSDTAN